jgi:hypothetical protein
MAKCPQSEINYHPNFRRRRRLSGACRIHSCVFYFSGQYAQEVCHANTLPTRKLIRVHNMPLQSIAIIVQSPSKKHKSNRYMHIIRYVKMNPNKTTLSTNKFALQRGKGNHASKSDTPSPPPSFTEDCRTHKNVQFRRGGERGGTREVVKKGVHAYQAAPVQIAPGSRVTPYGMVWVYSETTARLCCCQESCGSFNTTQA